MSKVKYVLLSLVTTVLLLVATVSSTFACTFWKYQPKTPKSLIK
ncbi:MAG: cyclic lactone autoinducer peptide [Clostridia bacterium]|nr:cyclic lactone autoinducer peptide [Clostridia bacterium]MDD4049271.1 cyclic lactone autoinducer peptide [Clostridia bacterium]